MSERRVVSLSMPTAAILARTTTGLNCVPRTAGYAPRHEAPVAVVPSSPAVAVKAGGVATLTGGDTTQPDTCDFPAMRPELWLPCDRPANHAGPCLHSPNPAYTTQPDVAELRERSYLAGSRVLYGTDYMRGEKERAYRLARKVIEASGLIEAVQTLGAAQR